MAQRERDPVQVDRAKTCPHLIRVFYSENGQHHKSQDFDEKLPSNEIHVHSWTDLTFAELFDILRIELNLDKKRDARVSIALVYPKRDGRFSVSPITEMSVSRKSPEASKQLHQKGFEVGDFVDVAIM